MNFLQETNLIICQRSNRCLNKLNRFGVLQVEYPAGPGYQRRTGMGKTLNGGLTGSGINVVAKPNRSLRADVFKERSWLQPFQNGGRKLAKVK